MVVDSSSLISLARAGLLGLLARLPERPHLLDVVWDEVVVEGKVGRHPDAFAIDAVLGDEPRHPSPTAATGDQAVLEAARLDGTLVANDLTLGRRGRNLGVRWLRTADLIVLLARAQRCTPDEARAGIESLWSAGRITDALHDEYRETLR